MFDNKIAAVITEKINAIGVAIGAPVRLYRNVAGRFEDPFENAILFYPARIPDPDNDLRQFRICKLYEQNDVVTQFYLSTFPGCCAYAISTSVFVFDPYRRKGVNKLALQIRELIAYGTGYTGLIATTTAAAKHEGSLRTLIGAGFHDLYTLNNRRTENDVKLLLKELKGL